MSARTPMALAKNGTPKVRQRALFWIARRAEAQAAGIITQAIDNDPVDEVKKQAVFALSQLPRDEGIPLLIKLARSHASPIVRKQSMFWLGQSKDPRALTFFEEVLR
jgi:HEAT repeat protein